MENNKALENVRLIPGSPEWNAREHESNILCARMYVVQGWKGLEMEQQAHCRKLARLGYIKLRTATSDLALTDKSK